MFAPVGAGLGEFDMIGLLLFIAVIGVIAWLLVTYVPMPNPIKTVIIIFAVIFCVLIGLRAVGIGTNDIAVPQVSDRTEHVRIVK